MNSELNLIFQKSNLGNGKRKQATARVFLTSGKGNLIISDELLMLMIIKLVKNKIIINNFFII